MGELVIHRLTEERMKDVQFLIKESFKRRFDVDQLLKKYDTSAYSEHNYLCTLGYINEQPVAFYGAIPLMFNFQGEKILGIQSCDSYTLPDYQGQGIHYKLAKASYELMREAGAAFVYAFHSANTQRVCERLDWELHEEMVRFHLKTNKAIPVFRVLSRFNWLKGVKSKRITRSIRKCKEKSFMENPMAGTDVITVDYSSEYIAYKNQRNNRILEINGCTVWVRFDYILQVGAISGLTEENVDQVLDELKEMATNVGAQELVIQQYPEGKEFELLSSRLEAKPSYPLGFLSFDDRFDFRSYRANVIELDSFL